MPKAGSVGISKITPVKQYQLEYLLNMHIDIVKGVLKRHNWAQQKYVYYDLNCGSGLPKGRDGSPLIFLDCVDKKKTPFKAYFIDKDKNSCRELEKHINHRYPELINYGIYNKDNKDFIASLIKKPPIRHQYGLIYNDPNTFCCFEELAELSKVKQFKQMDILVNCPATTLKRVLKSSKCKEDKTLKQHLSAINKEYWIIREPYGRYQFSLLIGTNWDAFPKFKHLGFYPLGDPDGTSILTKLSHTAKELKQMNFSNPSKYTQMSLF